MKESLDEDEFSQFLEGYLMNRTRGKPIFEDDASIAEAAAEYLLKEQEKSKRKNKQEVNLDPGSAAMGNKKVPILKITKGKLGSKTKKKDPDEEARLAARNKVQQLEIRGMEEMHWKITFKKTSSRWVQREN